jgi:DNA-binding Lrp family transcriptional regulator
MPDTARVLDAISDKISFSIFKIIKENAKDTQSLKDELNISAKQCYDRIAILVETGLIKRKAGYYSITSFGRLIFQAQAKVAKAIENLWKLKMVDAIRSSDLSKNEYTKLVDELIDDDELKDMIVNNDIK